MQSKVGFLDERLGSSSKQEPRVKRLPARLTVFIFDFALIQAIHSRLGLELDVPQLQDGGHDFQDRLGFVVREAHDLHGVLEERERGTCFPSTALCLWLFACFFNK